MGNASTILPTNWCFFTMPTHPLDTILYVEQRKNICGLLLILAYQGIFSKTTKYNLTCIEIHVHDKLNFCGVPFHGVCPRPSAQSEWAGTPHWSKQINRARCRRRNVNMHIHSPYTDTMKHNNIFLQKKSIDSIYSTLAIAHGRMVYTCGLCTAESKWFLTCSTTWAPVAHDSSMCHLWADYQYQR